MDENNVTGEQGNNWRERYDGLRQQEQRTLLRLVDALAPLKELGEDVLPRVQDSIQHLGGLFYLVVLGEFNAGKSAFVNALLGEKLMPEGVTPTTNKLHLVTNGPANGSTERGDDVVQWTYPADWLEGVYLVDTPGSNSLFRQHEALARQFIHWGDAVFFLMAANRAFAETDRLYLDLIREFGSKVVLVVNQVDLLTGDGEVERVLRYVTTTYRQLAGFDVPILPVSARLAQQAAAAQGEIQRRLWERSGFQAVWDMVRQIITKERRARQKLLTAANVGIWATAQGRDRVQQSLDQWSDEIAVLDNVRTQWETWRAGQLGRRQIDVQHIDETMTEISVLAEEALAQDHGLSQIGRQFRRWFMRIPLLKPPPDDDKELRLAQYLQSDAPAKLEGLLTAHNQQLYTSAHSTLASTVDHLNAHLATSPETVRKRLVGKITLPPDITQQTISLASAADQVETALQDAGIPDFVQKWTHTANRAWRQMLLWEAVVIAATWIASNLVQGMADERGQVAGWIIGTAVVLGALGLVWLPWQRRLARRTMEQTIDKLGETLRASLTARSESLLSTYQSAFETAIGPYARLVEGGQARLTSALNELERVQAELEAVQDELDRERAAP